MITAEKEFTVKARIHTANRKLLDNTIEKIMKDLESVIKHYEKESTSKVKVYFVSEKKTTTLLRSYSPNN